MSIPSDYQIRDYPWPPSQSALNETLTKILDLAHSKEGTKEDEWYDFKQSYANESPDEIRKDFSAMANSGGGYLLVGIKDDATVQGTNELIDDNRFQSILSDRNKISSYPRWKQASFDFNGRRFVLLKIEAAQPTNFIWIFIGGRKCIPIRRGSQTHCMADPDYYEILRRNGISLPPNFALDLSDTGLFTVTGDRKIKDYVEWTMCNNIFEKLNGKVEHDTPVVFPYEMITPVPFPNPRVFMYNRFGRTEHWSGSFEESKEALLNIEKIFDSIYRIGNSYWTVPVNSDGKITVFRTGVSASSLVDNLFELLLDKEIGNFAWSISSGFMYSIVKGEASRGRISLSVDFEMTAIPNGTPVLHVSEDNEVTAVPLPLHQIPGRGIGSLGYQPQSQDLWLDSPSNELLEIETHGKIKGLLGGSRPIGKSSLFPMGNLAVIDTVNNNQKIEDWPISCFSPMLVDITSYGMYSDFDKEIALLSHEMTWYVHRQIGRPSVILLFNAKMGINQESNLKKTSSR